VSTTTIRFLFDGETLATIDLTSETRCPTVGEYVYIDRSYHVINVANNYESLTDEDEDDSVWINVLLAEDVWSADPD